MSKMIIGNITFNVLKRDGNRILLEWTESSGIIKTRWIIFKGLETKLDKGV